MLFNKARVGLVAVALAMAGQGMIVTAAHADEYSFTATNTTETAITGILVSQNKSDWGKFDIGSGIKPKETVKLIWNQSTNDQSCDQWTKATFADGSESEPAKFNFCEDGLEIDF